MGPARSVPISSTYPLFATGFAVLGLGETLTLRRAVGLRGAHSLTGITLAIVAGEGHSGLVREP